MGGFVVEGDERALRDWYEIRYDLPLAWQESQLIGGFRIWATPEQASEFAQSVLELAESLRQPPGTDDPERIELHLTVRVLPQQLPG